MSKKPVKHRKSEDVDMDEFKLSTEIARDRRRERERKKTEKGKTELTSLDLSMKFCENASNLSQSPNSIKLTDFGRKCANTMFGAGSGSKASEEQVPSKKLTNKRLALVQNDYKLPTSMISSPSLMDKPASMKHSPSRSSTSLSSDIFTTKKSKLDESQFDQLKNISGCSDKKDVSKESDSGKEDDDESMVVDAADKSSNDASDHKNALKSVEDEMPPFKPAELKDVDFEVAGAWIRRSNQEQENFRTAIDKMKALNNNITEFRKSLSLSIMPTNGNSST